MHQAHAHGVEGGGRREALEAGAIIGVDHQARADGGRNPFQKLEEDCALVGGVGRIAVGVGEVREDATPLEASGLHERKELGCLLMPDAGATHTGVDLDVHLRLESRLRDCSGESLRLFERVQRDIEAEG